MQASEKEKIWKSPPADGDVVMLRATKMDNREWPFNFI